MPTIGRDRSTPDEIPGFLYGDGKIRASIREVKGIADEIDPVAESIRIARFTQDPPDMAAIREALSVLDR